MQNIVQIFVQNFVQIVLFSFSVPIIKKGCIKVNKEEAHTVTEEKKYLKFFKWNLVQNIAQIFVQNFEHIIVLLYFALLIKNRLDTWKTNNT